MLVLRNLIVLAVVIIGFSIQKIHAQKLDSLKKVAVDSVKKILPDTSKKSKFPFREVFGIDSVKRKNLPRVALYRSILLPGWGQATNKQKWLIPIIYAGAGGAVYSVWWNNDKYKFYRNYLIKAQSGSVMIEFDGVEVGPFTKEQIEPQVNLYRRQRDLTWIGFAVGWALQAVQANVQAHLRTFDTSDDISFKIEPTFQSTFGMASVGLGVRVTF